MRKAAIALLTVVAILTATRVINNAKSINHNAYNPETSGHFEFEKLDDGTLEEHFVYDKVSFYQSKVVSVDANVITVNYKGDLLSFYGDGYKVGDDCYIAYINGKIVDAKHNTVTN